MLLPPSLLTASSWQQSGQTGPSGQREASKNSRTLSSSVKAGLLRSQVMVVSYVSESTMENPFSQVYRPPCGGGWRAKRAGWGSCGDALMDPTPPQPAAGLPASGKP